MGKIKTAYKNIKIALKERSEEKAQERAEIKKSLKEIRKKSIQAGLEEREKQSIRFAQEKQKVYADRKIKALREPPKPIFQSTPVNSNLNKNQPPQESMGDWIMRI